MKRNVLRQPSTLAVVLVGLLAGRLAAQDLTALEEQAVRQAAARVAPSVVAIETIGGLERAGRVLLGSGPGTGLVVSSDGYIVSSLFHFLQKPATILVRLHDGTRLPARRVATDYSRMLVLLKVEPKKPLPVPQMVPEAEVQVGMWAVALGRSFPEAPVTISVGIISAKGRIWRRALQTDAKVSPLNYGGPLVDIRGRVLGVLVPLSPRGSDQVAGVKWYDSGIGFAVPADQVMAAVERMKEGRDLRPGLLGVALRRGHQFADPAVVASVRPNSPAYKAGIQPGDRIVKVGQVEVTRQVQLREALGPLYAGDEVTIEVLRKGKRLRFSATLVEKLLPYQRPQLGVLPLAEVPAPDQKKPSGVAVRWVIPDSAAQQAGIQVGDRIVRAAGQRVADADTLRQLVWNAEVGQKLPLQVERNGKTLSLEVTLTPLWEGVPRQELPERTAGRLPAPGQAPPRGEQTFKLPQFPHEALLYVPEDYHPALPHALLVWFHDAAGLDEQAAKDLLDQWKKLCQQYHVVLLAPKAKNPRRWVARDDMAAVTQMIDQVLAQYRIDPLRVVVAGYDTGGRMAQQVAMQHRAAVTAVACVEAPLAARPVEAEPVHPLWFYFATAAESKLAAGVQRAVARLRQMKHPVTVKQLPGKPRQLNAAEREELLRWIDTLDRI